MLKFSLRTVAAAIVALGAAGSAAAGKGDVYLGVFKDDKKPIVVFAFENAASPTDAMAVYVNTTYEQKIGEKFDPIKACHFTFDFPSTQFQVDFVGGAIYGPSSGRETILYPDLPTFFAQQAMKVLLERNWIERDTPNFAYYSSCVGFVWATSLSQDGKTWERIIRENVLDSDKTE